MAFGLYRRQRKVYLGNTCFACVLLGLLFLKLPPVAGRAKEIVNIEIRSKQSHVGKLPKFWAHTGLCPPAPTNDAVVLNAFFGGKSMRLCMEMVSVLHIKTVRIHWLLNLIRVVSIRDHMAEYDFSYLDEFLDHLNSVELYPVFQFMGDPSNKFSSCKVCRWNDVWKQLTVQIMQRYIGRYGLHTVAKWKFESWNEPDLQGFNTLKFNYSDYSSYLEGVSHGLDAVSSETHRFQLSGPAGLFKVNGRHPLCWGILAACNFNRSSCPINGPITFHRKGISGHTAREVVDGGVTLLQTIFTNFPQLRGMSYANSEADPTSGWSKPLPQNADVRYAVTLVNIVLEHWQAKYYGSLANLTGISHDNAFLSYYPYEFEQRTLLARFQMNLTRPPHVQMIEKPVYAALGMLSLLGERAGAVKSTSSGIKYLLSYGKSMNPKYVSAIFTYGSRDVIQKLVINFKNTSRRRLVYFVEYLEQDRTNPAAVWRMHGQPPYPNETVRFAMRKQQGPHMLKLPHTVDTSHRIELSLRAPWVLLVRICEEAFNTLPKYTIKNVRAVQVNPSELHLFWGITKSPMNRCIRTFEVFYQSEINSGNWTQINKYRHNPFQSFHYAALNNETILGLYKVRALDVFGSYGSFSKILKFLI